MRGEHGEVYTTITGIRREGEMGFRSQKAASRRWIMRNYDLVTVRVPKGQRDKIKEYAASTGESMNGLIRRAVCELLEREQGVSLNAYRGEI